MYLDDDEGLMTAEIAKDILGWTVEELEKDEEGKLVPVTPFGEDFVLRDVSGKKVRLLHNLTNRPFRKGLATKYANEIIRMKWRFNGETFICDKEGGVQDGQHRLVGLVLAQQMLDHPTEGKRWGDYDWDGTISIPGLLVKGIEDDPETVDSIGIGQKRTLGDIMYRREDWGEDITDTIAKRLSNMLAGALRLCWLRSSGKIVSDAPTFPPSEAIEFLEMNPKLKDACKIIYELDRSGGQSKSRNVGKYCSAPYAAGMLYLMGIAGTEYDLWLEDPKDGINFDKWDQAIGFWTELASGVFQPKTPLLAASNLLIQRNQSGAKDRDDVCNILVKAWKIYADESVGVMVVENDKDLATKTRKNEKGVKVPVEFPRLGGIDWIVYTKKFEDDGWEIDNECLIREPRTEASWLGKIVATNDATDEDGEAYQNLSIVPQTGKNKTPREVHPDAVHSKRPIDM